jgi:acyl-CoA reductase-like NAD-dependent aldehyde dehydrogenase
VASSHFNFSLLEPMGVVGVVPPKEHSLLGLISCLIPPLAGGNTVVVLSSEENPLCSVTLSEVIATSDVPSGVVNILTGKQEELIPHLSSHMDVNAIFYCNDNKKEIKEIQLSAVDNLKRIVLSKTTNWNNSDNEQPYLISDFMETKTTWHPIENIAGSGSGY